MGDGTKENPFTREDVLRLIKENGGKAEGLDLSKHKFVDAVDLSDLDLYGIILNDAHLFRANFNGSNLDGAAMQRANLQYATFNHFQSKDTSLQATDLRNAHLENAEFRGADLTAALFRSEPGQLLPAYLGNTDFRGANLFLANFRGCYFYGTKLEGAYIRGTDILEAHLDEADWSSYVIGEEKKKEELYFAVNVYRRLKIWYAEHGMYDVAGKFFFREMTSKRKMLKWWPNPLNRASSKLISMLCGYGERPSQVVLSAIVIIFGLAVAYVFGGMSLPYSIYFSAVSFTALGYGSWAYTPPSNWIQGLGAFESFMGVFMMALFLITFIRKMTR